jgi:excisionase family DNA binding protein
MERQDILQGGEMESLKSIEQTAEVLALSPWTVRAYVRQGKIRPVRIGRRVLIEQSEIQRVIESGKVEPSIAENEGGTQ